mmetsp:Transcript_30384/g.90056  ORF Transcript_30384/g.90056 Transcript_30384/m.90056 type:complete len:269 (+) Transcript_30384:1793-2599(+)
MRELAVRECLAVERRLLARTRHTVVVDQRVGAQVARQRVPHEVCMACKLQHVHLRRRPRDAIGRQAEAGHQALQVVGVKRPPTERAVAQAVVKRAEACAGDVHLPTVEPTLVANDLSKVPRLSIDVDGLAVDAVARQRQLRQCRLHLLQRAHHHVAHDVKPERVDAVVACPEHEVLDHQTLAHVVLRRGVVAASRLANVAVLKASVVVAWNDLVQHAVLVVWACREHMVIHDVRDDAEARGVQRHDEPAELDDARGAIGVGRVAPVRH